MEEHRESSGYSCQSCTRPDGDVERWVACDKCKLWEHYGCAGVDNSVRDQPYCCRRCKPRQNATEASSSNQLQLPPSDTRSLRSSTAKSRSKHSSKASGSATAKSVAPSTTSSTRALRLQNEMKLLEEEQILKEKELEAQEAIRKKEMEEELRRLEEKKAIMAEEAKLRLRQLQDEKEFQEKQQMVRKESLEKKQSLIRQLSECGSRGGSIPDSEQRIANWVQQCSSEPLEDKNPTSTMVPVDETSLVRQNPPMPTEGQRQTTVQQMVPVGSTPLVKLHPPKPTEGQIQPTGQQMIPRAAKPSVRQNPPKPAEGQRQTTVQQMVPTDATPLVKLKPPKPTEGQRQHTGQQMVPVDATPLVRPNPPKPTEGQRQPTVRQTPLMYNPGQTIPAVPSNIPRQQQPTAGQEQSHHHPVRLNEMPPMKHQPPYVPLYRQSTDRQGQSDHHPVHSNEMPPLQHQPPYVPLYRQPTADQGQPERHPVCPNPMQQQPPHIPMYQQPTGDLGQSDYHPRRPIQMRPTQRQNSVNPPIHSDPFDRQMFPQSIAGEEPAVPRTEPNPHRHVGQGQHQQDPNLPRQPYDGAIPSVPTGIPLWNPHQRETAMFPTALDANQVAARQVMGRELPNFSGNPEDWPIFICSFDQSTAACGYTDAENLIRLQRCLKGHALESVRSRLLLPSSVPQVINTLRTLYGRPELLIRSLIEKVHRAPAPRHDRLETVMEFGLTVQNLVDHLKAANQFTHLANPVLMQELVEKLPGSLKMEWAVYKSKQPYATLATFGDLMSGLVSAASQVSFELPSSSRNYKGDHRKSKDKSMVHVHSSIPASSPTASTASTNQKKQGKPCATCEREGHRVADCHQFKSFSIDERWKMVQQQNLCRTCLNSHGKWPCKSWQGCGIEGCRQKHHTLLHSPSAQPSLNISASHLTQSSSLFPMFRVLPVVLYAGARTEVVFAFIDEGSSTTLLEEATADRLGVSGPVEPLTLQWTGKVTREDPNLQRVQLDISGKDSPNRHKLREVRTVSCLVLPSQTMRYEELCKRYPHLRGLPVKGYDLIQPKLLIGLDNLRLGVPLKLREGGPMDPIAAKCRLGWSIYGCVAGTSTQRAVLHFHVAAPTDPDHQLNNQLRDYFALEDTGVSGPCAPLESNEEMRAKSILEQTTRRTERGFETGLLWRNDDPDFPDSYPMAVRRLQSLERKLAKDPSLQERVREQIAEYVQKGYAHKATESELKNADRKRTWFLPLGVVVHPKKPNKVRLVWDAAAMVNGVSFNSKLLKGPDLLTALPAVLSRFRQFPVAVCGDIKEMFHQLLIRIQDRLAQCFLWRNSPSDPIEVYVMDVATFGATCSPASAQYAKNLNAQEFAKVYPRAATAIVKNHYVDDYLDSFMTVQEAIEVVKEVILVHSKGGFEICRFRSNSVEILREIGKATADEPKNLMLERVGASESVLGMNWIPTDDSFSYNFNLRDDLRPILYEVHVPTKREVLKVVMSLFDPLGLVSHFLVHGKVIIQGTWASGTGWDEPINEDLFQKWRQWVALFPELNKLRIPRCYFSPFPANLDDLQVHTFVDASDVAYSCAVYFRLVHNGAVQMVLIGAKSKVAPLKTLSTPRLELKAAVLGVRFLAAVLEYHTISVSLRFFWSDSTTVLAWIRSDHRKFHKFVSVRIGEILTSSDPQEWRWVRSKLNVSDDATKWKNGPNLDPNCPWFQGPEFLRDGEESWPEQPIMTTTHEEVRHVQAHWSPLPLIDYSRFNRWSKLQRVTAYVIRFIDSLHRRNVGRNLRKEILTQDELARAEVLLWKMAQADAFPEERAVLEETRGSPEEKHPTVPKSSCIYKTWPFMDKQGILRMRGRIGAAQFLPFQTKFPVILPKQHSVTTLITDWYHRRFRHANRETVVNEMRQRYEVAKLRSLVQKVAKDCAWCRVAKALPKAPVMAPLPEARLQPYVRAFTYVGVDYFGPVLVKVGRSQVKRWIALFTCLAVRAVHMSLCML